MRASRLSAGLSADPVKVEPFIPEAFEDVRPKDRGAKARTAGLAYEEGLVAQLLRSPEENDPGRSVA